MRFISWIPWWIFSDLIPKKVFIKKVWIIKKVKRRNAQKIIGMLQLINNHCFYTSTTCHVSISSANQNCLLYLLTSTITSYPMTLRMNLRTKLKWQTGIATLTQRKSRRDRLLIFLLKVSSNIHNIVLCLLKINCLNYDFEKKLCDNLKSKRKNSTLKYCLGEIEVKPIKKKKKEFSVSCL